LSFLAFRKKLRGIGCVPGTPGSVAISESWRIALIISAWMQRADLLGSHDCGERPLSLTLALSAGESPKIVSEQLGHA
jgi:hypothetical protein